MKTIALTMIAVAVWGFFSPFELKMTPYAYLSLCFIVAIIGMSILYFSYKRQMQKKIVQLKHERLHYEQQACDLKQVEAKLRNCEARLKVSDQQHTALIKSLNNKTCRYLELEAQYQILNRKYASKHANYCKLLKKYNEKTTRKSN